MKHLLTLFFAIVLSSAAFSQTLPNGDLESWDSLHSATTTAYWWQPSAVGLNWMNTLNSLAGLPATTGGPGPVTVFRTTDAYSGTYAAKLVTDDMNIGAITILIPGMLGTAVMNNASISAWLGNPCPGCKPLHFKGYYKYEPVLGDSGAMVAMATRWNSAAGKKDTIGYGKFVVYNAVNEYTPFDITLNYTKAEEPDSLTLLMVSNAGFNVVNFLGSVGQIGSTMYVDEVSLEYPAGIEQSLMPEVAVKVYPNPATEVATFELSKKITNGMLEIYSGDGKLIKASMLYDTKVNVNVNPLPSGSYFFKVKEGKHLLATGTFVRK